VLGGLAGLRLVGMFIEDWHSLTLARRARGVGDGGGVRGAARRFFGPAFSLLVISVRRGSKLATAMEARGFGSDEPRTWARLSQVRAADAVLVGVGCAISGIAIAVAVWAGTWSFVLA
jgi:energy-coupling factor transport system permease protein